MAKVSLRIYNREIGTLIDQGQIQEAVGHCIHILKTFPKHLETYRLLGKAYLEAGQYNDAADIFSRVLMAVPNDFVSHAGMSMVADEKGNLDEAIWHMQRAFEAHPSNTAVQEELQRLYGRRDGVEPPKIRMTNGALAHVYIQGELYAQAIAEIRGVEAQDPDRMDMQVLLAYAYFRSGQRVKASQVATSLLTKSPYCFDANRILVEILPETSRSDSVQIYRRRVNALDPYAAFVKKSVFDADSVPDAAVNLERLDWNPKNAPLLSAGWKNSESIRLDEKPAWLQTGENIPNPEPDSAEETPSAEEQIPEFMRAAGWSPSSGEAEEPVSFFDSSDATEEEAEEIAQAELPDWMKTMAPAGAALISDDEKNEMGEDEMASDDWINDLLGDQNNEEEAAPAEKAEADSLPDWLQSAAEESETQAAETVTAAEESVSDAAIGELGVKESTVEASDELRWITEAAREDTSMDETLPAWLEEAEKDEQTSAAIETEMPTWIQEEAVKASEEIKTKPHKTEETSDWIEEKIAEESLAPEAETDDLPKWLRDEVELTADADKTETQTHLEGVEKIVEEVEEVSRESLSDAVEDDAPTWIKAMDAEGAEEPSKEPDLPAWLEDMESEETDLVSAEQHAASEEKKQKTADVFVSADEIVSTLDEKIIEQKTSSGSGGISAEMTSKTTLKRRKRIRRMDTATLRDITLMGAQVAMDEGNITASLKEYGKLIRKKRLLDEVIFDLREALDEYPINIDIWQMLGDAYLRAGRLQEAIDAYTNAEKLLR